MMIAKFFICTLLFTQIALANSTGELISDLKRDHLNLEDAITDLVESGTTTGELDQDQLMSSVEQLRRDIETLEYLVVTHATNKKLKEKAKESEQHLFYLEGMIPIAISTPRIEDALSNLHASFGALFQSLGSDDDGWD